MVEKENQASGAVQQPPASAPSQELLLEERIGGMLGKAFRRLKKTQVWQKTAESYRKGLEGDDKVK